jgi:hypothetical protein
MRWYAQLPRLSNPMSLIHRSLRGRVGLGSEEKLAEKDKRE